MSDGQNAKRPAKQGAKQGGRGGKPGAKRGGAPRFRGIYREDGRKTILYVLGSTRSGTSALRNAIYQTRYNGYGEGHMEPLLSHIVEKVRAFAGTKTRGNARDRLEADALLEHLFRGYEEYLSEQQISDYLMDKTPSSRIIAAAPMLNRYHGDAKFIFCARRHVDNVQSKIKKFSGKDFTTHCQAWASANRAWERVRDQLDGNYLAFDFHDLAVDPAGIAARIAAYLELPPEEETLMAEYLVSERPQSESATRDLTKYLRLSELDWTDEQREIFQRICGPLGESMGYGYERYFRHQEEADAAAETGQG